MNEFKERKRKKSAEKGKSSHENWVIAEEVGWDPILSSQSCYLFHLETKRSLTIQLLRHHNQQCLQIETNLSFCFMVI